MMMCMKFFLRPVAPRSRRNPTSSATLGRLLGSGRVQYWLGLLESVGIKVIEAFAGCGGDGLRGFLGFVWHRVVCQWRLRWRDHHQSRVWP